MQGSWRIAQILEGRTDAHPHSCHPRQQGNNPVAFLVGRDVHDPDLQVRQQPPRRIDVKAAQFRLDLGQRLITHGGNVGGDDHKRTIDRQPKLAGDIPQAPIIESSSLKQSVNQIRTSRRLSQELPLLLVAVSGHQGGRDQFGKWLMWSSVSAGMGPGRSEPTAARPHRRPSTMMGTPTAARNPNARGRARREFRWRCRRCPSVQGGRCVAAPPRGCCPRSVFECPPATSSPRSGR